MPTKASTTTVGIMAIAILLAVGGLAGASLGLLGNGPFEQSSVANGGNDLSVGYNNEVPAISWIAFCGDADGVEIEFTWFDGAGDPAAVNYTVTGGSVDSIIYFGGGTFWLIHPAPSDDGFVKGDGNTLEYSPQQFPQAAACSIDEVDGDTIDRYEWNTGTTNWQDAEAEV